MTDRSIRRWRGRLVLAAAAVVLAACSSITPPRMVPDGAVGADRTFPLRVSVAPVTGARETFFGGAPFPKNEEVRAAVVGTLEKSRLFTAVVPSGGDAELTVTLVAQDQQGMMPTTARMVANYRLARAGGDTIWSETYDTTFSAGDFAGATRTVRAQEGAVRENLRAFLAGVRDRLRLP